jgi:hypothetical protein
MFAACQIGKSLREVMNLPYHPAQQKLLSNQQCNRNLPLDKAI